MPRPLVAFLLVVATGAIGTGLWWGLTVSSAPPPRQPLSGLEAPVTVGWSESDVVTIEAQAPQDALAALGYVHGVKRGWTLALWRQTALGRLSEWFGPGVVPIDRHALRLGLRRQARRAYDRLPDATRRGLHAYSRGVQAALQSEHVQEQDPFVLLDLSPARWEPWHSVLIERLMAWLATDLIDTPSQAPKALKDFRRNDHRLRRWLHLHGWNRSAAWALRSPAASDTTAQTTLFQRHVLGSTAQPVVQDIQLRVEDRPPLLAATVPGAPLAPTGLRNSRAWTLLLSSSARLARTAAPRNATTTRHARIAPVGKDEQLVSIRRLDGGMPLGLGPDPDTVASASADSTWLLRWPGFRARSDLGAWMTRAGLSSPQPQTKTFRLFDGSGLQVSAGNRPSVLGRPAVVERDSAGRLLAVGESPWLSHQAQSLKRQLSGQSDAAALAASDSSTWAAALLPRYRASLGPRPSAPSLVREARTYLRNWAHRFAPSSIGATVFDRWVRTYRASVQTPPPDESVYFADYRRRRALRHALDTLVTQYGRNLRRWRWEEAAATKRAFPVWSADSLVAADLSGTSRTQYAPLSRPGQGHPSVPAGGPSFVTPPPLGPATATWEGWFTPAKTTATARRLRFDPQDFFAQSLLRSDPPPKVSFSPAPSRTTVLVPSGAP